MWSRTWRAWAASRSRRSSSSAVSNASRYACERNLRVDDDRLAAGDPDDEVGSQQLAVGVARRGLGDEVAVLEHARELDHVAQLRLAPAAADVRRAQRVCQVARAVGQDVDLLAQRAVRLPRARSSSCTCTPTRWSDSLSGATVVSRRVPASSRNWVLVAWNASVDAARTASARRSSNAASEASRRAVTSATRSRRATFSSLSASASPRAAAKREQHGTRPEGEADEQADERVRRSSRGRGTVARSPDGAAPGPPATMRPHASEATLRAAAASDDVGGRDRTQLLLGGRRRGAARRRARRLAARRPRRRHGRGRRRPRRARGGRLHAQESKAG